MIRSKIGKVLAALSIGVVGAVTVPVASPASAGPVQYCLTKASEWTRYITCFPSLICRPATAGYIILNIPELRTHIGRCDEAGTPVGWGWYEMEWASLP